MRLLSPRTIANEVPKQKHNDKLVANHKNNYNDGAKHKNNNK